MRKEHLFEPKGVYFYISMPQSSKVSHVTAFVAFVASTTIVHLLLFGNNQKFSWNSFMS